MPHVTIEYTSNIIEANEIDSLFLPLHRLISDQLAANIENCKTKAYQINHFQMAEGSAGFVMVELVLKKGRDEEIVRNAATNILKLLENFFHKSITEHNAVVTLEIKDLSDLYYKTKR